MDLVKTPCKGLGTKFCSHSCYPQPELMQEDMCKAIAVGKKTCDWQDYVDVNCDLVVVSELYGLML